MDDDNIEENYVPETNAVNRDGGAAKLDADPINQSSSDAFDSLLDSIESGADTTQDNSNQYTRNVQQDSSTQQGFRDQNSGTNSRTAPDELDPEIAAIQPPQGMSEKQMGNWESMRKSLSDYKKQAAETSILKQRLEDLQTQAAQMQQPQLPPDYQEWRQRAAILDIQNDPSFRAKYDAPINESKGTIYSLLRKYDVPEESIKAIEEKGGPTKITEAWWKTQIIDKLQGLGKFTDARRIENAMAQIEDVEAARDGELKQAKENSEQWLHQKEYEKYESAVRDWEDEQSYIEELTQNTPFRFQEVPPSATPEQVQKIESHNATMQDLAGKYDSAKNARTPKEKAAVYAAAVYSHVLTRQLQFEQTARKQDADTIKKLMSENSALKGAGRAPRSNVNNSNARPSNNLSDRIKMSAGDAIDAGLDEAGA